MSDDKLPAFKAGDWQTRPARPAAPKTEEEDIVQYERTYPLFRQYLTSENFNPLFQLCEKSCTELDRIIRTGTNELSQEAQYAVNAFGRSMQLATELLELKAKFKRR